MSGQDSSDSKDVLEALDRVLEELRREFAANPEFAHRVVRALGANVVFDPKLAAKLINPIELVARETPEKVAEQLGAWHKMMDAYSVSKQLTGIPVRP